MFALDTGQPQQPRQYDGALSYKGRAEHAERRQRQIIEMIQAAESDDDITDILTIESAVMDALERDFPEYHYAVMQAVEECKIFLSAASAPGGNPANNSNQGNTTMNAFAQFDQGSSGLEGPFVNWSARGTQDGEIDPKSFYLRTKDGKEPFEAFSKGVVWDIDGLKTGWQKSDGVAGVAPEWVWGDSPAKLPPRPGEDFKAGFQVQIATPAGDTMVWQQAGAAVWNAIGILAKAFADQKPGTLPVVKITGTEALKFAKGSTVMPILEVVKWVPRPDSLKEEAGGFQMDEGDDADDEDTF